MSATHIITMSDAMKPSVYEQSQTLLKEYSAIYGNRTVVLMQIGIFYEIMGETAKDIAQLLNISLVRRSHGGCSSYPLCGFPIDQLKRFLAILLKEEYTVIIVEQKAVPKKSIERKVTGIYEPDAYFLQNRMLKYSYCHECLHKAFKQLKEGTRICMNQETINLQELESERLDPAHLVCPHIDVEDIFLHTLSIRIKTSGKTTTATKSSFNIDDTELIIHLDNAERRRLLQFWEWVSFYL